MEPGHARTLFSQPWQVYSVWAKALRRTAALAEMHGVPVFWVIAPIIPEGQARRDALGFDAQHTRNLRAVMGRMPNVVVLDARHAGYPASAFFDSCHLNAQGARRLSAEIAEVIGDHLVRNHATPITRAERWVELRPFDVNPPRIARGTGRGTSSSRQ
jgi:hypothetical protein